MQPPQIFDEPPTLISPQVEMASLGEGVMHGVDTYSK